LVHIEVHPTCGLTNKVIFYLNFFQELNETAPYLIFLKISSLNLSLFMILHTIRVSVSYLRVRCSRWTRTCPKDGIDATRNSLSSNGHSENDGIVASGVVVAAEDVVAERRDTGEHYHSICCAADNTRSAPMH